MENIINSFAALGAAWNATHDVKNKVKFPVQKSEKPRKCRLCGFQMEHIAGTNIFICHGTKTVTDKDGAAKEVPCGNFTLAQA